MAAPRRGNSRGLRRRAADRIGFTLVEVLIALGVLAILVSLAWPSVLRLQGQQKLMSAAEMVRALAASARSHAIESGLVYQFRYESKGRRFVVIPFEREIEGASTNSAASGIAVGAGQFSRASGEMPEGVGFDVAPRGKTVAAKIAAGTGNGQQLKIEDFAGLPDAGTLASTNWSGPVLFQADGSATDAEIVIADTRNQQILLRVRGLTGAVSLTRVQVGD